MYKIAAGTNELLAACSLISSFSTVCSVSSLLANGINSLVEDRVRLANLGQVDVDNRGGLFEGRGEVGQVLAVVLDALALELEGKGLVAVGDVGGNEGHGAEAEVALDGDVVHARLEVEVVDVDDAQLSSTIRSVVGEGGVALGN